ncbi:hypothetical protein FGF1_13690 [Flavobacteriaceae bacterium GF1]
MKRKIALFSWLIILGAKPLLAQDNNNIDWWKAPHRFLQFNLQVKDAPLIDAEELILYAKDTLRAEGIMLQTAGIYAWYPTKVPYHNKNPYMEGRDVFGELNSAAKKHGLKVLARTDWSKTTEDTYADFPEWFVLDSEGSPSYNTLKRPGLFDKLIDTDGAGPYRNEAVAIPAMQEIIKKYAPDAFFFSFASHKLSYGPYSRTLFRKWYDKSITQASKKELSEFRIKSYYKTWKNWYAGIKVANPNTVLVGRLKLEQRETIEFMSQYCDVNSTQPRDDYKDGWSMQDPRWKAAVETNFARAAHNNGERPLILTNTAPGLKWRHAALPKGEFDFWTAQIISNGGNWLPSTTGFPKVMEDKITLELVRDFNSQIEKIQPYLSANIKQAKVGVLNGVMNFKEAEDELYGFFETLINAQVQFDVLSEYNVKKDKLEGYDLLILPNQKKISNAVYEIISAFTKKGGRTLSSFETGLEDESGKKREKVFFDQSLNIEKRYQTVPNPVGAYYRIEDTSHPLFKDFGNTKLIPYGEEAIKIESDAQPLMTLVPNFSPKNKWGVPPERASLRKQSSLFQLGFVNANHIYFPGRVGQFAWQHRLPISSQLLRNAIIHLAPNSAPVTTINHEKVMVNIFKKGRGYLIFLVNNEGERPMPKATVLKNLELRWNTSKNIQSMKSILYDNDISFEKKNNSSVYFTLDKLKTWDVLYAE